jgi:tRNA (Thr-GGU) A37 N-methylase
MYSLVPVGYVRSPFKTPEDAPRQGRDAGVDVTIAVEPAFVEALAGIEESDRLQIACWLNLAARDRLRVHPRGDPGSPRVRGIDAVDGTPVVDIKPHSPRLDD